jgi:CxxC motif-containing protein (DUF1111 family)
MFPQAAPGAAAPLYPDSDAWARYSQGKKRRNKLVKHFARVFSGAIPMAAAIAIASWVTFAPPVHSQGRSAFDPGVRSGAPGAGKPLAGLTAGQLAYFEEGQEAFDEEAFVQNPPEDADAGLGPGFNSDSCGSCHDFPEIGGSSPFVNKQVEAARKLGAKNFIPSFITEDGPTREVRFKFNPDGTRDGGVHNLFVITGRSDASGCDMQQENFSNLSNLSFRIPTPTFGLGLVESIPDTALRANLASLASQKAQMGIAGRLNVTGNDGTITRFGWKAQNKSLIIFAGEAYNVESGITNQVFPQERHEEPGCMFNETPEDTTGFEDGADDDIVLFSAFMRFLAPPERGEITDSVRAGEEVFNRVGCHLCHTPTLTTGTSPIAALSGREVPLYSDLALHHMGSVLADDVEQGVAQGDEFRTAPLWGLGQRIFFLHDGRTKDLLEAIRLHAYGGSKPYPPSEANAVIRRFNSLNVTQQQNLLDFLRSL